MTKLEFMNLLIEKSDNGSFPCINEEGCCRYRMSEKRCVVGWIIPDDVYTEAMEGYVVRNLNKFGFNPCDYVQDVTLQQISAIQSYHDGHYRKNKVTEWDHENFILYLKEILNVV